MLTAPDPFPDDVATLQALVTELVTRLAEHERALQARDQIIETLKAQLAVLRRRSFGQTSEKLGRAADQLELQIEDLEQHQAQRTAAAKGCGPEPSDRTPNAERAPPVRKPLPSHLRREDEQLASPYAACPGCGGALRRIGEDVSEVLEVVPARLRRYVRPVMACRGCGDVS